MKRTRAWHMLGMLCVLQAPHAAEAVPSKPQGQWSPSFGVPIVATHAVVLPEKGPTSTRVLFFNDAIPGPTDSNYTIGHVATIPPMGNPPLPGNWTKVRQDEINFFCSGTNYARGGVISIAGCQLGKYYEGTKTFVVFDPAMMTFKRRGDMEPTFQPDHPMGAGHLLPAADPWRNRP